MSLLVTSAATVEQPLMSDLYELLSYLYYESLHDSMFSGLFIGLLVLLCKHSLQIMKAYMHNHDKKSISRTNHTNDL